MIETRSPSVLVATLLVAAALAGCERKPVAPPKTDAPGTATSTAPGAGPVADRSTVGASAVAIGAANEADRNFAQKAASAGLAEVAITKHAMEQATSAEVKKIAAHLHKDHSQANETLRKIAAGKGIALPAAPEGEKKAAVEQVGALSGAALDRAVLEKLAASHRESIKLFEQEANQGSDAALKAFAASTLPTLREHLKMVEAGHADAAKK
jgi:putative membrane protein